MGFRVDRRNKEVTLHLPTLHRSSPQEQFVRSSVANRTCWGHTGYKAQSLAKPKIWMLMRVKENRTPEHKGLETGELHTASFVPSLLETASTYLGGNAT